MGTQRPNFRSRRCWPCGHFPCPNAEAVRQHLGRNQWKVSDDFGFTGMFLTAFTSVAHSPSATASNALQLTYSLSQRQPIPTTENPSLPDNVKTTPPPLPAPKAIYSVTARQIMPVTGECMFPLSNVEVFIYSRCTPDILSFAEMHADPDPTPHSRNSCAHVRGHYGGTEQ
jgi:hypothetical protein